MYIFHIDALAHPHAEFSHRLPRRNGIYLWRNLYDAVLGRTGVVLTEDVDIEHLETWLRVHNVRASVYEVLDPAMGPIDQQIEHMMITNGQRSGDMYVDVDAKRCAAMLERGVSVILLGDPFILRKEWNEEKVARPSWDELVAEMDRQAVLRSKKDWQEEA